MQPLLKAAIAADFNRPEDVAPHLIDADFIFIESNHDLELLKKYYNPNSATTCNPRPHNSSPRQDCNPIARGGNVRPPQPTEKPPATGAWTQ